MKLSDELKKLCKTLKIKITDEEERYWLECPRGCHFIKTGCHEMTIVRQDEAEDALEIIKNGIEKCTENTPCDDIANECSCYWED